MQDTKTALLGVFILLSGLVLGSMPAASEITVDCNYSKDKKTAFCLTDDEGDKRLWRCDKQRNGTWKCYGGAERLSSAVKPDLKNAVRKALKHKSH